MSSQFAGLMPQVIMLALAAGVAVTLIIVAVFAVVGAPRARMKKRIAAVVGAGPQMVADVKGGRDGQMAGRKKQVAAKLREAEEASQRRRGARLRQALTHAGLRTSPQRFMLYSAGSGLFFVLMTWLFTASPVMCLVALPIGLFGLPKLTLNFLIKRRRQKFTAYFADAIDVIVRGVRAGLTTGECLNIVARELPALDLEDKADPGAALLRARAEAAEGAALAVPGITNSEGAGASWGRTRVALATSTGFAGDYAGTSHSVSVSVLAGEGTGMERDDDFLSARHGSDLGDPAAASDLAEQHRSGRGDGPGGGWKRRWHQRGDFDL